MPLFLMSMSWTNNGIKTLGNWPKRMKDTRAFAKKLGITIKEVYLTMGEHDLVAILEAPDADRVARFALGIGPYDNVRTKTAQAWTEKEFGKLLEDLPTGP